MSAIVDIMPDACLWFMACALVLSASIAVAQPGTEDQALVRSIEAGELDGIDAAARSGNGLYVPHLLRVLENMQASPSLSVALRNHVRIALATLDEPSTQRDLWCRSAGPDLGGWAVYDYASIGGWYSVHALMELLRGAGDGNYLHSKRIQDLRKSDCCAPPLPSDAALELLPDLLPEAGIEKLSDTKTSAEGLKRRWRSWVPAHEADLRLRRPLGEGLILADGACR